jgi:hypothetical protein
LPSVSARAVSPADNARVASVKRASGAAPRVGAWARMTLDTRHIVRAIAASTPTVVVRSRPLAVRRSSLVIRRSSLVVRRSSFVEGARTPRRARGALSLAKGSAPLVDAQSAIRNPQSSRRHLDDAQKLLRLHRPLFLQLLQPRGLCLAARVLGAAVERRQVHVRLVVVGIEGERVGE